MKKKGKVIRYFSSICSLLLFTCFLPISCSQNKTVKVGFIADLSSRNAEVGIQARNGFNMAVDGINENGGINGQMLEPLIGNHKGDNDFCAEVVRDLIDQGAHIIIGPFLSGMASTVITAAKES